MKDEVHISIDIEADGPIPGDYSMSSFGLIVVDRPQLTFYRELKPISEKWVPEAAAVSGLDREKLKIEGYDPHVAMRECAAWVYSVANGAKPVFVAFNATFDWSFMHWYFIHFYGSDPFGISGLDVKAWFGGHTGCDWRGTVKREVVKLFPSTSPHTHNALDDAKEQAQTWKQLYKASSEKKNVSTN